MTAPARLPTRYFTALTCTAIALIALSARGDPASRTGADPPGRVTAEQLRKSARNLERIALAIHNCQDTRGMLTTSQLSADRNSNPPTVELVVTIAPQQVAGAFGVAPPRGRRNRALRGLGGRRLPRRRP